MWEYARFIERTKGVGISPANSRNGYSGLSSRTILVPTCRDVTEISLECIYLTLPSQVYLPSNCPPVIVIGPDRQGTLPHADRISVTSHAAVAQRGEFRRSCIIRLEIESTLKFLCSFFPPTILAMNHARIDMNFRPARSEL